jgi:hypothetical protein
MNNFTASGLNLNARSDNRTKLIALRAHSLCRVLLEILSSEQTCFEVRSALDKMGDAKDDAHGTSSLQVRFGMTASHRLRVLFEEVFIAPFYRGAWLSPLGTAKSLKVTWDIRTPMSLMSAGYLTSFNQSTTLLPICQEDIASVASVLRNVASESM